MSLSNYLIIEPFYSLTSILKGLYYPIIKGNLNCSLKAKMSYCFIILIFLHDTFSNNCIGLKNKTIYVTL